MGCTTSKSIATKKPVTAKKDKSVFFDRFREPDIVISNEEKTIIKRQWETLSADMEATGTAVFMRIFTEHPEIKCLFSFKDIDNQELPRSTELRRHSLRFMQAIGAAINNIDDIDSKWPDTLLTLGKQHTKFTGFKPLYFQVFYDAILHAWKTVLDDCFTTECTVAWGHLLVLIMEKLKKGYHLATLEEVTRSY